jgi:hypothetical protein
VLQYLSTSEGTLVASYEQVAALEARVQQQQAKIDTLEQTQTLFQQSLETYLDVQFQQAQGQRGSYGKDFSNTIKFLSAQLASTVSSLQAYCVKTVQESLPLQKLQDLEKRLSKSCSATTQLSSDQLQAQIIAIQLQLQSQQHSTTQLVAPQPIQQTQEEIDLLKQHIHHLETNLLEEVQRAYRTVHKPGDYGGPLAKLQTTVQLLNQEFQSFRGFDVKQFVETLVKTAHENLRAEFNKVLETRASYQQLQNFESTVHRVESFSKDVQTGFHKQTHQIQSTLELCKSTVKLLEKDLQSAFTKFTDYIQKELEGSELQKRYAVLSDAITLQAAKQDAFSKSMTNSIHRKTVELNTHITTVQTNTERRLRITEDSINAKLFKFNRLLEQIQNNRSSTQYEVQNTYSTYTKCFYTALIGTKGQVLDTLATVIPIPGWDYICFTNQKIPRPAGWTLIQIDYTGQEPATEAKRYKWLSHLFLADYDITVWVDAYIAPNIQRQELLKTWIITMLDRDTKILHKPHPMRNCVWEECDAVVQGKRETKARADRVRSTLEKEKMPHGWGLFDTNIIIKFNKDIQLQKQCEDIYTELSTLSNRDQLAVTRIYYKNNYSQFHIQKLDNAFDKIGVHVHKDI